MVSEEPRKGRQGGRKWREHWFDSREVCWKEEKGGIWLDLHPNHTHTIYIYIYIYVNRHGRFSGCSASNQYNAQPFPRPRPPPRPPTITSLSVRSWLESSVMVDSMMLSGSETYKEGGREGGR